MMNQNRIEELQPIIEKLILLGDDADELNLWLTIAPSLDDKSYAALLDNLKRELEAVST